MNYWKTLGDYTLQLCCLLALKEGNMNIFGQCYNELQSRYPDEDLTTWLAEYNMFLEMLESDFGFTE